MVIVEPTPNLLIMEVPQTDGFFGVFCALFFFFGGGGGSLSDFFPSWKLQRLRRLKAPPGVPRPKEVE